MKFYWGDLHNHCAISYGAGTLKRALNNARSHLDFCSVTGHAFWPDMPMDLAVQDSVEDTLVGEHLGGFEKLRRFWPRVLREMKAAERPGQFVLFPSYEWHSREFGDYNCYFSSFDAVLQDAPTLDKLAAALKRRKRPFMLLPHHCGYMPGYRGTNWSAFDDAVSPLAEIYSNHGCCEADDAPYDYHHSMGPRAGVSTIRRGLMAGKRFGFYAGTDTHDGYPGHYGHGITAVRASSLSRGEIWKAMRSRRTIASTGARITADFRLGDTGFGGVCSLREKQPEISLAVEATSPIVRAEFIEGDSGGWKIRPILPPETTSEFRPGRYKIKIEAGWGRHGHISQWDVDLRVTHGRLLGAQPCFRHSPHPLSEEDATESLNTAGNRVRWQCRAVANPSGATGGTHFNAGGTQAIVLEVDARRTTRLKLACDGRSMDIPLPGLAGRSEVRPRGRFQSVALKVHRASPSQEWTLSCRQPFCPDAPTGFVYARVVQSDGHVAWISPVWWER